MKEIKTIIVMCGIFVECEGKSIPLNVKVKHYREKSRHRNVRLNVKCEGNQYTVRSEGKTNSRKPIQRMI